MKYTAFLVAILFSVQVSANGLGRPITPADPHPAEYFDFSKRITDTSQITVKVVDDVREGCFEEAKRLNSKPTFKNPVACSFWGTSWCVIVVGKRTSIENLGHEVRHCFQGAWH